MSSLVKTVVLGFLCVAASEGAYAERTRDGAFAAQYKKIQQESQLFDLLQKYNISSPESAKAMQSTMTTLQLEEISTQLRLINKNLNELIALELRKNGRHPTGKKG